MKKVSMLTLLITILLAHYAFAQTGKIAGTVTDINTGNPLPGANITLQGTNLGAAANINGYYMILNVPAGTYDMRITMMGYTSVVATDVRVNINLTTEMNVALDPADLVGEEVVIVAERPVVRRDVASSQANLGREEIDALPVVSVAQVVSLEAGVRGMSIRGGDIRETAFMVNGFTMRDERDNTPFTSVSLTSVEQVQIQTGGFEAEYGNIRSGIINVVTKEGRRDQYHFGMITRYSPVSPKHFGHSANSSDSYWIKPYLDDEVCWTGTSAWDEYTRNQYPAFEGWNAVSARTMQSDDPNDHLTPQAAQELFLWQHRRQLDIQKPDYDIDVSFGGPVPFVSKKLGNLRFFTSYRRSRDMYIVPLSDDGYRDYTAQLRVTVDLKPSMKLTFEGLMGRETGTGSSRSGGPGIFQGSWGIAAELSRGPKYIDSRMFSTDYWCPSTINRHSIGLKLNHIINPTTYYEVTLQRFGSKYDTNPGNPRDTETLYLFGNSYYTDEGPFGYYEDPASGIGSGMRMGVGMSNSRDSSEVTVYSAKFDITTQIDRYNNIKTGIELIYTDNNVNYAMFDKHLSSNNIQSKWRTFPIRGAFYIQDKIEFESMIATLGLRLDYSHAGGEWYNYDDPFTDAFSAANYTQIDTLLDKSPTERIFTLSPRLGVAFPVTVNSKFFFNYGHFRQMPTPENLFLIRRYTENKHLARLANPNNPLPLTIAYELGYEHNIFDQFLIRISGYYKDSKDQSRLVRYVNMKNTVNYAVTEPNSYRDTRGFELTLRKNRGNWVHGFLNYTYEVTTSGFFGFGTYYQNPATQRQYERETRTHYQEKPVPRPYARANVTFFTPNEFGPKVLGIHPLDGWRFNILADWRAGSWDTWTGGGFIPGIQYNVQWRDYWNVNIRFSKDFRLGQARMEFFVDVNNLFNYKYMSSGIGFVDAEDYNRYMRSLHLPAEIGDQLGYGNIPGSDRPGDYRTVPYEPYDPNDTDEARKKRILETRAYIDMPNLQYLTFLGPRNVFWGFRASIDF